MKFQVGLLVSIIASFSKADVDVESPSRRFAPLYSPKNSIKNRFIVVFHDNTPEDYIASIKSKLVMSREEDVHHTYDQMKAIVATLQRSSLKKFRRDHRVKFIERDSIVKAFGPQCSKQSNCGWCLQRVANQSVDAYNYPNSAGKDVVCYVIDTGVNIDHPDLQGRAVRGINYVSEEDEMDRNGHGTAVSSLIAGNTCGTAKQAKIVGVKVLDKDGSGLNSNILRGIEWSVQQRTKKGTSETQIINLSLGGGYSYSTNEMVNKAHSSGILVVVAAGNSQMNSCSVSPASAKSALTVGATDSGDSIATFSNYGNCVKIFAPGVKCLLANGLDGGYREASGTSFASPLVAGVAACYLGENRKLTPTELQSIIIKSSKQNAVKSVPRGTPNRFVTPACI